MTQLQLWKKTCHQHFLACDIMLPKRDPAVFKLFVIMMETLQSLTDITTNMKKVLAEETYLDFLTFFLSSPDV